MNKIYLVEHFARKGRDVDGTLIEDVEIVGYFTNKKQVAAAMRQCARMGVPADTVRVVEYNVNFRNDQKYVYVLLYEYLENDGFEEESGEYYAYMAPCATEQACMVLRKQLALAPPYEKSPTKHYYDNSPDGFCILRYTINKIQDFDCLV